MRAFSIAFVCISGLALADSALVEFTENYDDGSVAVTGSKKNGKYHGLIRFYDQGGRLYKEATYVDGTDKVEGRYTIFDGKGNKQSTSRYRRGLLDGDQEQFYANGGIESVRAYRKGARHGPYRVYHRNGKIAERGYYVDGEPNGAFKKWDRAGSLLEHGRYAKGLLTGEYRSYQNGKLSKITPYLAGQEEGWVVELYDSGRQRSRVPFKGGAIHGRAVFYRANGALLCSAEYRDSKRHGKLQCFHDNGRLHIAAAYANGALTSYEAYTSTGASLGSAASLDEVLIRVP